MAMEAQNRAILNYGWMNFPLAYTQVVTFTVYFYFFSKLFSDQYLIPDKSLWSEHANVTNVSYVDSGKEIHTRESVSLLSNSHFPIVSTNSIAVYDHKQNFDKNTHVLKNVGQKIYSRRSLVGN